MPLRVLPVLLATFALLFVSLPTSSQRLGETACAPGSLATDDLNQCGGGQPAGSGLQRAAESVIDVCTSRSHQAEQHPSWRWLAPPLVAAVAALIASACCAHMLRLQAQLRSLQPTAEDERKPCTSRSRARDPSRWQACSSREDSAMLRSPPHSDGRSATGELGSSSSGGTIKQEQEQEQEQELTVDEGGTPTRQEVADRVALTSPFLAAAIRRRPFSQSASLSPPVSTSPCDNTTCSSRPPRVLAAPAVGRYEGTGPCTPANLSRCGSLPPLPAAGPSQPASLADLSSLAASTAPVHGRHPPPPSEPSLLSPFPSGGFSCMFERQASALPELMQLVAAYQAKCPGAVDFNSSEQAQGSRRSWEEPAGSCRPMAAQLTATSAGTAGAAGGDALGLPLPLLQSLVNPVHVEYLHGPDGRLEQLGAGASSRVYKALYNGDIIAAKELDIGGNPELRESFVTEVLLLQHLRHPHIIGYFGLSLTANKGVLLLEYAEGRDLHSALQLTAAGTNERLFGWRRRGRRVAYEVAKGLNYLHSKGVTHMDIKSGNVLLTASGEARLSDVGLSRHAALNTGSAATGARCIGTFAWMAPELLLDADNSCTPACDIYSYGVLLLEILTGERPIRGRMRSPKVPEECPQEVADLAMRCLATDPKQRPCAAQLLKELGMLLLKRAFAADRTTTNLLGSRTGSLTTGVKRRSADGVALRTLRLEPLGEGMRRSISVMHYPLLEAAAQGFDQPSAAARLSALLQPQPEVVPQDHDLAQQEADMQLRSYSSCGLE